MTLSLSAGLDETVDDPERLAARLEPPVEGYRGFYNQVRRFVERWKGVCALEKAKPPTPPVTQTTSLRFAEVGGLRFHRVWAEWLAAQSGGIYLPFELYELYELANGVTALKVATPTINLIIRSPASRWNA
jgi:hypothetical protein